MVFSKTIFADRFSRWSRGQDAGSPGGLPHFFFLRTSRARILSCLVTLNFVGIEIETIRHLTALQIQALTEGEIPHTLFISPKKKVYDEKTSKSTHPVLGFPIQCGKTVLRILPIIRA